MAETTEKITLFPSQVVHAERLIRVLERSPYALDFSQMGLGKTYTGSHIALTMGFLHVILVAPVSVQPKWNDMRVRYGVPITENISFCSIRSVRNKQPSHGLLSRRDFKVEIRKNNEVREISKTDFRVTDKFREFVREGALLLVDEIQFIKNVTAQTSACQALVRTIVDSFEQGGRSRVLMLSGSPLDKEEQVATLFRTLNLMQGNELCRYNIGTRTMECTGITDIIEHCKRIDLEGTEKILRMKHRWWFLNEYNMRRLCYLLFQDVFKPHLASAMPPTRSDATLDKYNGFYDVKNESDRNDLTEGVRALQEAVRYDSGTGRVSYENANFGDLTRALVQIEEAKVSTFLRIARDLLMSDEDRKLVICLNYRSSIQKLKAALSWWDPLVLDGTVSKTKRKEIIDAFQAPTHYRRVLIGNVSVCSTGIDLDDKHGGFPRTALVSPNYSTITLYQLCHRFQRLDTKSDASVEMVYAKHCQELSVLNALARKGGVMKQTTREQVEAGVLFPGDFPRWDEEPVLGRRPADLIDEFMKNREERLVPRAAKLISRAYREYLYRPEGLMYRITIRDLIDAYEKLQEWTEVREYVKEDPGHRSLMDACKHFYEKEWKASQQSESTAT
ncbi:hypothetical protein KFL_010150030 [Klebsormidium nitens]|uniref:Uncharacterized protein n=1 Tax=Klebsormidium nitens TaxID=105231 RepID=A0A1Y1INH5_KLENI|nr:hypothetical protein KFL_010150030 [Klebsormidium nitens]|eukprot:GAQ92445.1 hypothetical protein KFL_010150030 [Klebsormidium nitens]